MCKVKDCCFSCQFLTLTLAQKKGPKNACQMEGMEPFSRPLQSSLLVAGGGGSRARQESSGAFSLNAFPGSYDGTVPYPPPIHLFLPGGRLIHKQGTHTHTLLWPCPRVDAAQNIVRLSVERGRRRHERDGSQTPQKVDDSKTPQPSGSHMSAAVQTLHPQTTTSWPR